MSTRKCHWPEIPGFSACPPCPLSLIPLAVEVRQAAPQTIRLVCAVDALVGPQRGRGGGRDPAAHPPLPCPLHTSSPLTLVGQEREGKGGEAEAHSAGAGAVLLPVKSWAGGCPSRGSDVEMPAGTTPGPTAAPGWRLNALGQPALQRLPTWPTPRCHEENSRNVERGHPGSLQNAPDARRASSACLHTGAPVTPAKPPRNAPLLTSRGTILKLSKRPAEDLTSASGSLRTPSLGLGGGSTPPPPHSSPLFLKPCLRLSPLSESSILCAPVALARARPVSVLYEHEFTEASSQSHFRRGNRSTERLSHPLKVTHLLSSAALTQSRAAHLLALCS